MLPVHCYCCLLWLKLWLRLKQPAFQLGTGLQEPGQGIHWRDWSSIFTLKTTINSQFIIEFSSERPPRINKKFPFSGQKNIQIPK
jgi:hypothetical protein